MDDESFFMELAETWVQSKAGGWTIPYPRECWFFVTTKGLYLIEGTKTKNKLIHNESGEVVQRYIEDYSIEELKVDAELRGNLYFFYDDIVDMKQKDDVCLTVKYSDGDKIKTRNLRMIKSKVVTAPGPNQTTHYFHHDWSPVIKKYDEYKK